MIGLVIYKLLWRNKIIKLITTESEDTLLPIREIDPSQIQPHLAFAAVFDELGNQTTDKTEKEYCKLLADRQRYEIKIIINK